PSPLGRVLASVPLRVPSLGLCLSQLVLPLFPETLRLIRILLLILILPQVALTGGLTVRALGVLVVVVLLVVLLPEVLLGLLGLLELLVLLLLAGTCSRAA